jgi:hypothetical protein
VLERGISRKANSTSKSDCMTFCVSASISDRFFSSCSGLENRDLTAVGIRCADHATPSIRKSWHYADKRRSLGRYSSLAD